MNALTSPCAKCPFRKDCMPGWLGEERMAGICNDTVMGDQYFTCHETTDLPQRKQRLCAGKLILEERANPKGNSSTRVAIALGFFPGGYDSLKNKELVFDNVKDAIKHHS